MARMASHAMVPQVQGEQYYHQILDWHNLAYHTDHFRLSADPYFFTEVYHYHARDTQTLWTTRHALLESESRSKER